MRLTKKHENDVVKAMRCVENEKAYHWQTIAIILAKEVKRLKEELIIPKGE